MTKVLCTCSCGKYVSRSTKQNHLKGRGTTALRATVLAETESLKILAGHHRNSRRTEDQINERLLTLTRVAVTNGSRHLILIRDQKLTNPRYSQLQRMNLRRAQCPRIPLLTRILFHAAVIQSNRVVERTST